jgi:hypothetical protein
VQRNGKGAWEFADDAPIDPDDYLESISDACDNLVERVVCLCVGMDGWMDGWI